MTTVDLSSRALSISAATFQRWLEDGQEIAVLDVRSVEAFAKGEPLYATNVPAAQVLRDFRRFVPRAGVRTVLVDDGRGEAETAARALRDRGEAGVVFLDGGVPAWLLHAKGGRLPTFDTSGLHFSLGIREELGTPVVTAAELKSRREAGADVVVLDTRTVEEFARGHVPGALSAPGAELLRQFKALVPSPDTEVLVSCAGLPRAIIGAQTLIDAGVPNRVAYLADGTRGWTDIGGQLEGGLNTSESGAPGTQEAAPGNVWADRLDGSAWVSVDLATARAWQADPARTTYLLDVRQPQAHAENGLPDTLSAEGGQLLGVSHRTLAVRGARVVLIDDLGGVRARTVAHWLRRRGFELAILRHDFGKVALAA